MIKLTCTPKGVLFNLRVSPGKNLFEVKGFDEWTNSLLVSSKEPAQKGKANQEIVRELGKIFGTKVEITKGKNSRNKTVKVHASKSEILPVLKQLVA